MFHVKLIEYKTSGTKYILFVLYKLWTITSILMYIIICID